MFNAFFAQKKWAGWAWGMGTLLILGLYVQVELMVMFNEWYGQFYTLMQHAADHEIGEYWQNLLFFAKITIPYIAVATLANLLGRFYAFKWREAITFAYLEKWRTVTEDIEGSSQRMQEDIYRFAKIIESLGLQIVRAIMTLLAFIPILWGLSSHVQLPFLSDIQGSLVWVALAVSLGGLLISWLVGIKLPGLEYNNQKVEAAFRKELVYAEDDKENYASLATILELFTGLKKNYFRLFLHYGYFDIWAASFEQIMLIVPFIIMGPSIMSGLATFGMAVQVSNSFGHVQEAFSIFISNWTTITELRSVHKRLREFETNIGYREEKCHV
ncbi:MAG: transporter [Desulfobacterales bacterium]|nr:MAG: transporter [Desulfobacterales bacterium]